MTIKQFRFTVTMMSVFLLLLLALGFVALFQVYQAIVQRNAFPLMGAFIVLMFGAVFFRVYHHFVSALAESSIDDGSKKQTVFVHLPEKERYEWNVAPMRD
ncbi:MAG: hypothetical protein SFU56_04400 [Capsulimonadales bacterium]|nr:hypothetical protein [Capsulimonadales bacterium]